jgi:hypothetical protein
MARDDLTSKCSLLRGRSSIARAMDTTTAEPAPSRRRAPRSRKQHGIPAAKKCRAAVRVRVLVECTARCDGHASAPATAPTQPPLRVGNRYWGCPTVSTAAVPPSRHDYEGPYACHGKRSLIVVSLPMRAVAAECPACRLLSQRVGARRTLRGLCLRVCVGCGRRISAMQHVQQTDHRRPYTSGGGVLRVTLCALPGACSIQDRECALARAVCYCSVRPGPRALRPAE